MAQAIPIILALGSAYMTYQQGQAQQDMAEYNAAVARNNALAVQYQAEVDARNERKRISKLLATQRMLYGKAGVTLEGTPLLVMEETAREGEKEAQMIEYAGRVGASRQRSQADVFTMQGASAATGATWSAGIQAGRGLLTLAE